MDHHLRRLSSGRRQRAGRGSLRPQRAGETVGAEGGHQHRAHPPQQLRSLSLKPKYSMYAAEAAYRPAASSADTGGLGKRPSRAKRARNSPATVSAANNVRMAPTLFSAWRSSWVKTMTNASADCSSTRGHRRPAFPANTLGSVLGHGRVDPAGGEGHCAHRRDEQATTHRPADQPLHDDVANHLLGVVLEHRGGVRGVEVGDEDPVHREVEHRHQRAADEHGAGDVALRLVKLLGGIARGVPAAEGEGDVEEAAHEGRHREAGGVARRGQVGQALLPANSPSPTKPTTSTAFAATSAFCRRAEADDVQPGHESGPDPVGVQRAGEGVGEAPAPWRLGPRPHPLRLARPALGRRRPHRGAHRAAHRRAQVLGARAERAGGGEGGAGGGLRRRWGCSPAATTGRPGRRPQRRRLPAGGLRGQPLLHRLRLQRLERGDLRRRGVPASPGATCPAPCSSAARWWRRSTCGELDLRRQPHAAAPRRCSSTTPSR